MNIVFLIIIMMPWGLDRPWEQAQLRPNAPVLGQRTVSAVTGACIELPRPVKHQDSEMPQACVLGEEMLTCSSKPHLLGSREHVEPRRMEGWAAVMTT